MLPVGSIVYHMKTQPPLWNCQPRCYLNSMTQLLLPILKTISHNFQFDSSTEGPLSKCLFETTQSASNSTDVDALKFRLVWYDTCYDDQVQQDSSACLMMLTKIINSGSVFYCGSNDNNYTGVSQSDILLSFMLGKCIVCNAWELISPSFESSSVLYITSTSTASMQELIMQGLQQILF